MYAHLQALPPSCDRLLYLHVVKLFIHLYGHQRSRKKRRRRKERRRKRKTWMENNLPLHFQVWPLEVRKASACGEQFGPSPVDQAGQSRSLGKCLHQKKTKQKKPTVFPTLHFSRVVQCRCHSCRTLIVILTEIELKKTWHMENFDHTVSFPLGLNCMTFTLACVAAIR